MSDIRHGSLDRIIRPALSFDQKLESARKELLETTTRSRLLHTPIGSKRAKIIEVTGESAQQVFDLLVGSGKAMTFLHTQSDEDEPSDEQLELPVTMREAEEVPSQAVDQTDNKLQTSLTADGLQAKLRSISYDAQSLESEQGVNLLYLALGFLKWFENKDREKPRYAPLVLVPVQLSRGKINEQFKLTFSGEDISTNLPLQQRLKQEEVVLPSLPEFDEINVDRYAALVSSSIDKVPNWEVMPDAIVLGFFSFAKLMMYRDLDPHRWPSQESLREHPLVYSLLGDGFNTAKDELAPDDSPVDPIIDIASVCHVVDADSSQMLAIHEVESGKNMVIEGPPGTGKSQTITNLIASAVRSSKHVLFVAEKMAALNVVKSNLDRIGLGHVCLELHSHKAKKKAVLEDLEQTYRRDTHRQNPQTNVSEALRKNRDILNEHARRIHTQLLPSALTPFQIFGKLALLSGQGIATPDFQLSASQFWTKKDIDDRAAAVNRLASHISEMGTPNNHPWRGACLDLALPEDSVRFAEFAGSLSGELSVLLSGCKSLSSPINASLSTLDDWGLIKRFGDLLKQAPGMDFKSIANEVWNNELESIHRLIKTGQEYADIRMELAGVLTDAAIDLDLVSMNREIVSYGTSIARWLRPGYRDAVKQFRSLCVGRPIKKQSERLGLLSRVFAAQEKLREIQSSNSIGITAFGTNWRNEFSSWANFRAISDWQMLWETNGIPVGWKRSLGSISDLAVYASRIEDFSKRSCQVRSNLDSLFAKLSFSPMEGFDVAEIGTVEVDRLCRRLSLLSDNPDLIQQWCIWRTLSAELLNMGLGELLSRMADGRIEPKAAVGTFLYTAYETLSRKVMSDSKDLAIFDGRSHEKVLEDFKKLDLLRMEQSREEVAAVHRAKQPTGDRDLGEMGILRKEWRKQRRLLPIRQLVKAAGNAIQLIKPVWMMSPMSLAQFLEPGAVSFDLILMDEASQIKPVDALGAIARGRQLVVVGDDKQLPPTSFFDRAILDEMEPTEGTEFQAADVESILGLCSSQGVPNRMLRWHYRSQHESLIAISNQEFYKKLYIVPSSFSTDVGLRYHRIQGVYDRGKSATNRIEARAVAAAVVEHARTHGVAARYPIGMSLGVGTFSVSQRDAILDELESQRRQNLEVEAFFIASASEPFFVKNLETIQGDERDVIFISVGYGPDDSGMISMGFGPLTAKGGERRLNVLITRARRRCEVFSSLKASEIDLSRTPSFGVRVLKSFLQYAETGHLDKAVVTGRGIDSDFEEDVGSTLASLGYPVEHQVGVAGFFIDLAIRDSKSPGCYILGIECDGAAYHSSQSARDRDRLREQVLRDRGWRIHRIWGTDWYRRRNQELQRLIGAISAAAHSPIIVQASDCARSNQSHEEIKYQSSAAKTEMQPAVDHSRQSRRYVEASILEPISNDAHLVPLGKRLDLIIRIVKVEGPIHEEELARRYASSCGKERSGSRILQAVREAILYGARKGQLHLNKGFCSIGPTDKVIPRDRSEVKSLTLKELKMIPPIECLTGLLILVRENIGLKKQDAIVELARMLGFHRTGQDIYDFIEAQCEAATSEGLIKMNNANLLYLA